MTGGRKDGRAPLTPPPGETPIIVLVRPQMARNIGSVARAMANGGLFHLRIVAPRDGWPQPDAYPSASGADAILDGAQVFESVPLAVADCHRVLATCPRPRHVVIPVHTARAAAEDLRVRFSGERQYCREHVVDGLVTRSADGTAAPVEQRARRLMAHVCRYAFETRVDDVPRQGSGDCHRIRPVSRP